MFSLLLQSKHWILMVLLSLCATRSTCGIPAENVTKLMDDLLCNSNYSKYIRPVKNQNDVLELKGRIQFDCDSRI